jgi:hypothetical protein
MNPRAGKRTLLRYAILGLVLCLLVVAALLSSHPQPKPKVWIRFEGLSTNSGRIGWDCTVAVPKPERYDAVLYWGLGFETTNKSSLPSSTSIRIATNTDRIFGPQESSIVACGWGPPWETGQVYRAIGCYQPGNVSLVHGILFWTRHFPVVQRLLPTPTSYTVTSQWTEVTTLMTPF